MTKTAMTEWNPERDLAVLLDALTDELLAASDRDVAAWLGEIGEPGRDMVEDVRRLVAAAEADPIVPPVSDFVGRSLRASVTRN